MDHNNYDKSKNNDQSDGEIISPMFGYDYKNRVIPNKVEHHEDNEGLQTTNYLEKQIEEELEEQKKQAKVKEYQDRCKTDTDVLRQYHKQKEQQLIKATLPSNYLNFRDNLEKIHDTTEKTAALSSSISPTMSEMLDDIFED